jgi:hypothetical protein
MEDPIVEEVRRVRQEHAAKFDYDLDKIFEDIKRMEKASGRAFISLHPKRKTQVVTPESASSLSSATKR